MKNKSILSRFISDFTFKVCKFFPKSDIGKPLTRAERFIFNMGRYNARCLNCNTCSYVEHYNGKQKDYFYHNDNIYYTCVKCNFTVHVKFISSNYSSYYKILNGGYRGIVHYDPISEKEKERLSKIERLKNNMK